MQGREIYSMGTATLQDGITFTQAQMESERYGLSADDVEKKTYSFLIGFQSRLWSLSV
jgi:hypothetical protein